MQEIIVLSIYIIYEQDTANKTLCITVATRIHNIQKLAGGHLQNTAHYCITDTNFADVQFRILADQVIPFYIESGLT
jgi:hypothetical protein